MIRDPGTTSAVLMDSDMSANTLKVTVFDAESLCYANDIFVY